MCSFAWTLQAIYGLVAPIGRATRLHRVGCQFESDLVHQRPQMCVPMNRNKKFRLPHVPGTKTVDGDFGSGKRKLPILNFYMGE